MNQYQMGVVETHFADIVWENEPLSSTELVSKSFEVLGWKKSTTYTVLRRLCEKGILKNTDAVVTSVISKDQYFEAQSRKYVDDLFGGSLPAFVAAFSSRQKLTSKEIDELRKMIDGQEEANGEDIS
ncbi:MAG: BlaI/MecI/CopY family transcriptional regulator [Lachnospiraceae bacterium]|nr:BlaI/MecI/CopY family transcriptional regulator [Lachnospiraceae bacterium]